MTGSTEEEMRVTKLMLAAALIALVMSSGPWMSKSAAHAKSDSDTTKRLNAAADVLREVMATPDKGIPKDLLDKAACAVIVPNVKKGAFIIGAKYGRGFILCRNMNGRGWSAPGGVKVEGGSVGFQIGGSETDVVMLLMNQGAIDKLLSSKFTIGGDASVAAGPVGRTSSAKTDAQLHAELLSYSRARGLFAGVSLDGATLRPDDDANKDMYGRKMSNQEVVLGNVKPPRTAARLIAELNRHSSRRAGS
ncbi:MAG: lipid-binding SYLF domain-containing protein [Acidobacteriota bacterium]|nr:lipid-binding SYLF domain-containing protein [Acidobacteriota bacterium]